MSKCAPWVWKLLQATLASCALAGCGGNLEQLGAKAPIDRVYVMGDSLADVGAFGGLKFTVMDPADPERSLLWPELIARHYGTDRAADCSYFDINISGTSTHPACNNYAVGGARIVNRPADTLPTVSQQLQARSAQTYLPHDLVLLEGGSNDAADLLAAFLDKGLGNEQGYQEFLLQQLTQETINELLTQDPSGASAATAYMRALANTHFAAIEHHALDMGAQRVAVLNIPDITLTPYVQQTLAALGDELLRQQTDRLIERWISAFNSELQVAIGQDTRVALVDFYADIREEMADPSRFLLTDVSTPVCNVPKGEFGTFPCLSTELDALPERTSGWWNSYAFSDDFHPTPYGHQLLAASVARALARAGWL